MTTARAVLLDDRLLIEELLHGLAGKRPDELHTTTYWYYRACRAAVIGAGGQLSGPFERLGTTDQRVAILALLELRDDIGLPDARLTVPAMARIAVRHPKLNLLNLEAVAAATVLSAETWLSSQAATGVLPGVLDSEGLRWRTVELAA